MGHIPILLSNLRITDAMDEVASRVMGHPVKIGG
jgi:hypothetical protein